MSANHTADLQTNGFTVVQQLTSNVEHLVAAYEDIVASKTDCGDHDRQLGGMIHQVMNPSQFDQRFADHEAVATAKALAGQWMDWDQPTLHFDMLICQNQATLIRRHGIKMLPMVVPPSRRLARSFINGPCNSGLPLMMSTSPMAACILLQAFH